MLAKISLGKQATELIIQDKISFSTTNDIGLIFVKWCYHNNLISFGFNI